jgi:hypothetical protein
VRLFLTGDPPLPDDLFRFAALSFHDESELRLSRALSRWQQFSLPLTTRYMSPIHTIARMGIVSAPK